MDIIRHYASPNFDSREGTPVSLLVMHYTGMETGEAALARLCDPAARVSAHYLIEEDGRVFALVAEGERAWHAGLGSWRKVNQVNHASIGIELVNPGHEFGYRAFPAAQMASLVALSRAIMARHSIAPWGVIAHSDLAPMRKEDPGELFDWPLLAGQGIGLWPEEGEASVGSAAEVQGALAKWGYPVMQSAQWDEPTAAVIRAFQRHYRPERVDGQWDAQCAGRLANLLHGRYKQPAR